MHTKHGCKVKYKNAILLCSFTWILTIVYIYKTNIDWLESMASYSEMRAYLLGVIAVTCIVNSK